MYKKYLVYILMFFIILIIGAGIRAYHISSLGEGYSEIHHVVIAESGKFSELANILRNCTNHPIGHYISLNLLFKISGSAISQLLLGRFFSYVFGIIAIVLIFILGKEMFNRHTAFIAMFLLAVSPVNIYYSQLVTRYTLLLSVVLAGFIYLCRLLYSRTEAKSRWNWIFFSIFSTLAPYVCYYAYFLIVAENIYVFLHRKKHRNILRKWFLAQLMILILLLPNILFMIQQVANQIRILGSPDTPACWAPDVVFKDVIFAPLKLLFGFSFLEFFVFDNFNNKIIYAIGTFFILMLIFLGFLKLKLHKYKRDFLLTIIFSPLVMAFPFVFLSLPHYTNPKYFMYISPIIFVLIAAGLTSFRRWRKVLVLLTILSFSLMSLYKYYYISMHECPKPNWEEISGYIEENKPEDALLYASAPMLGFYLKYGSSGAIQSYGIPFDYSLYRPMKMEVLSYDICRKIVDDISDNVNEVWVASHFDQNYDTKDFIGKVFGERFYLSETKNFNTAGNERIRVYKKR